VSPSSIRGQARNAPRITGITRIIGRLFFSSARSAKSAVQFFAVRFREIG
jgi:hypothetical protein